MTKKIISVGVVLFVFMAVIGFAICDASEDYGKEIYTNHNIYGVTNNSQNPTIFTINEAHKITLLENYHYFNFGTLPGTISLRHEDGTIYGPWQTTGKPGQGGVENAYWECFPNETIKAGTYTVIDSHPETWSNNAQSGYAGMTKVWGIAASETHGGTNVAAAEEFAWVLVDTHRFSQCGDYNPITGFWNRDIYAGYANPSGFHGVLSKIEGNTMEIKRLREYGSVTSLHAKYTWSNPPSIIQPKEMVSMRLEQEVITNNIDYPTGFRPFFGMDVADLNLGYGTAGGVDAKVTYADGTEANSFRLERGGDAQAQQDFVADMTLQFRGEGREGAKRGLYVGIGTGNVSSSLGIRYTYEWKQVKASTTPAPATGDNRADAFESGTRITWQPVAGLGYRLFRSTSQENLGISVTDFYITSTSYADVNVEPNTTYYYTVKPVLAEAKPFEGIEEKLGAAIYTFTVKTGNLEYTLGSHKRFIMLKLDSPYMSVDGASQEVDPGRGTTPVIIAGRTMVPIRAVVEAMGGTIEWEASTQKITLKARGSIVEMWLGKTDIQINGVSKKMDVAPVVKEGRTFVPLRFAAENLDSKVAWITSTREAVIIYEE